LWHRPRTYSGFSPQHSSTDNFGVNAINIPDGPRASSRISPIITAQQIFEKARIEPILHFCCRDKNLIGIQADLLGCAAIGVRNILFITGDPPKLGDYPFASAVFDVDSIGAVKIQKGLNGAIDLGGKAIQPATRTLIGVGADPNALDLKRELRRTFEKVAAGAEFIITQPVFDVLPLLSFLDQIQSLNIPVIAGIWPLVSYRNAEFMKNEVPGVIVPDEVMQRMARAKTKEAQRETGIQIARESIAQIRERVAGVQVSAPFGLVATAIAVISDSRVR
jgi:homocysteine S-methyltransferase